jgi:hypothetical protein
MKPIDAHERDAMEKQFQKGGVIGVAMKIDNMNHCRKM